MPTEKTVEFPRPENFDIHKFAHQMMQAGEDWAQAAATLELLEEGRKVLLAKLKQEHFASGYDSKGKGISRAEAEDRAYADDRYRDYLKNLKEKRETSLSLRVRFDSAKMYVELIRSHMATQRAEIMIR